MGQPNSSKLDVLTRRLERYGSCMAIVRWHIREIIYLRQEELLGLLVSVKGKGSSAESTMRTIHVIRYAYLNLRFVLEQMAFGMALAHYDALQNKGLLNWKPKTIMTALNNLDVGGFFPRPVYTSCEHLSQQDFLTTYGRVNSVLHTGNPLKMETRGAIDRLTSAPAIDAAHVLTEAHRMTGILKGLRNLLAEHRVPNSFEGCGPWLVHMCDEGGQIRLSGGLGADTVECHSPFRWPDEGDVEFWRHGKVP